ncbi:flavodoxin family protein [Paraburkholderia megapolitana]|uniref:Flavodoxin n=1 Tax=Paraburkholderia megapolitana TaxID=420953 RepID=A0A1I3Q2Y3_9BURK|nr:flavodoxin [Paraburkholderia megapolitana]SFJ27817.1 Flavodoxin [Paraburkholderia megapolitana]
MPDAPRFLVIYYSREGVTSRLAERLAAELGADIEPIRECVPLRHRPGFIGYLGSLIDAVQRKPACLVATRHDPAAYDIVVVGTPVWAARASAPVATWLAAHRQQLLHVAFFCSKGEPDAEAAFERMREIVGKAPVATCSISASAMRDGAAPDILGTFARKIRSRLAIMEAVDRASAVGAHAGRGSRRTVRSMSLRGS